MAAQKLDETKITKALECARKKGSLIEDDYFDAYSALLDFFNKLDLQNEQNVIGAAHAVYGWMPTILKKETKTKELMEFVGDLRKIEKGCNQKKIALSQLKNQIAITKAINGSIVGTSKFLHFVEPKVFPIWDSNVARAFDVPTKINDQATYLAYCEVIHLYLDKNRDLNWPKALPDGISKIRKIELCLYAYGKSLKSKT
ncbi:hypothetical protein GALL_487500 [mine drainage metagenome]|uniref:Uncharacterized protein n=1 Tax=mine drainage metagenome TaxID=410659 RepID=A0A1J5PE63_9ZZZZ